MAPISPPAYLQAGSYSARLDRLGSAGVLMANPNGGPLTVRSGVRPTPGNVSMKVVPRGTPDRWVSIGAGTGYIQAASSTGGVYVCHNDASFDVQTAASHATLARRDLIVARVYDAVDHTGTENKFVFEVVTGTAAGSPTRPATPPQALALAEVLIPAGSTTVGTITDLRPQVVATGGVLPIRNASEFPSPAYPGLAVYREDIGVTNVYSGTANRWVGVFDDSLWFSYGCIGRGNFDCSPNYSTNSTTGAIVKIDSNTTARVTFQMPPNVPANRMVRIETVMSMSFNGATSGVRGWLGHYMDNAGLIGNDRRMTIPNDTFFYEGIHVSTIPPSWISVGTHYVEPRLRVDNSAHSIQVTSLEMSVSIL